MTARYVIKPPHGAPTALHVTEPVRPIDTKEKRRQRVSTLLNVVNNLHKKTLATLAK